MQRVDAPRGVDVHRVLGVAGVGHGAVETHPEAYVVAATPQLVGHHPVAEQEVVGRDQPGHAVLPAGRVVARGVAEQRRAEGLVEGRPRGHPVAQDVVHRERVVDEAVGGVAVGPAARVLEHLGQVPVVERQPRRDVAGEQLVDEPVVERQPGRVGRTGVRAHPRPRHREAVRRGAEVGEEVHVVRHPVVVVAGDLAGVPAQDGSGDPGEGVPDGGRASVLGDGPLDLVGRGGHAPHEVGREAHGTGRLEGLDGCGLDGHPLTAPCMMPSTIWRPVRTKRISSGIVAIVAPARTRL